MMQPLRTGQDAAGGKSRRKLDEMSLMKKECERTRKTLPDYLRGHVFWSTRNRTKRHLGQCVVCKSEFDALRGMEETRQLLKYLDPPEGVGHRVKEGVSALTRLTKILYRPLWLTEVALVVAGVYYYAMLPRQLDLEIEGIVKTAPVTTRTTPTTGPKAEPKVGMTSVAGGQTPTSRPASVPAVEPLAISIIPINETHAIRRINEVLRGHGQLRNMKFGEAERELSGKLTTKELLTFFDRIESVAKVRYNRKLFSALPTAEPIPFVLTLKAAPKADEKPMPAQKPAPSTETHAPAETAAPAPQVTAPPPAH